MSVMMFVIAARLVSDDRHVGDLPRRLHGLRTGTGRLVVAGHESDRIGSRIDWLPAIGSAVEDVRSGGNRIVYIRCTTCMKSRTAIFMGPAVWTVVVRGTVVTTAVMVRRRSITMIVSVMPIRIVTVMAIAIVPIMIVAMSLRLLIAVWGRIMLATIIFVVSVRPCLHRPVNVVVLIIVGIVNRVRRVGRRIGRRVSPISVRLSRPRVIGPAILRIAVILVISVVRIRWVISAIRRIAAVLARRVRASAQQYSDAW